MNIEKDYQALKYVFGATTKICKYRSVSLAIKRLDERYNIIDANEMGNLQSEYEFVRA